MQGTRMEILTFVERLRHFFGLKQGDTLRVAVAGNIGVGKSTYISHFEKFDFCKVHRERFDENPYLPLFYQDRKKYAFQTQMWFLGHRLENNNDRARDSQVSMSLFDRHLIEDQVFARANFLEGNISAVDKQTYDLLFDNIIHAAELPHLIIYLKADSAMCNERILRRSRDIEINTIDPEYLKTLETCYDEFEKRWGGERGFVTLDWSEFHDIECTFGAILKHLTEKSLKNFSQVVESREI